MERAVARAASVKGRPDSHPDDRDSGDPERLHPEEQRFAVAEVVERDRDAEYRSRDQMRHIAHRGEPAESAIREGQIRQHAAGDLRRQAEQSQIDEAEAEREARGGRPPLYLSWWRLRDDSGGQWRG